MNKIILETAWFWIADNAISFCEFIISMTKTWWGIDYLIKVLVFWVDFVEEWWEEKYYVYNFNEITLTRNNIHHEYRLIKSYLETYDINIMFILSTWALISYFFPNLIGVQATKIFLFHFFFIVNFMIIIWLTEKWVVYAYCMGIFDNTQLLLIFFSILFFFHFPGNIIFMYAFSTLGVFYIVAWVVFFYHLYWLYTFFWWYDIELAVYLSPYIWFYIAIYPCLFTFLTFINFFEKYSENFNFSMKAFISLARISLKKYIIIFLKYSPAHPITKSVPGKWIRFYRRNLYLQIIKTFHFKNMKNIVKNITSHYYDYLFLWHRTWLLLFMKNFHTRLLYIYKFSMANIYISARGFMAWGWWWTFYYNFFSNFDCPWAFWWSGIALYFQKIAFVSYILFLFYYTFCHYRLIYIVKEIKLFSYNLKLVSQINFFYRNLIIYKFFSITHVYFSQTKFLKLKFFKIILVFITSFLLLFSYVYVLITLLKYCFLLVF